MDGENMQSTGGGSGAGKWIVGVVVLVLVVWGLVAASKNKNQDTTINTNEAGITEKGTYKLGVLLPLTGDAASYGEILRNVAALAAEEINNANGANGDKIELVLEDAKCNGKDAASAMQKLVNVDKVQAVIGGFCSSESLGAEPIATANKVVMLSPGSSNPGLTGISQYFFRIFPSDSSQGQVGAEIANKKGYKKIAFIVEQKDYPLGIYGAFEKRFVELGGQLVKEEFPPEGTDFRSQLTKLRAAKPEALYLDTQTAAAAGRILKQLKDMNWEVQLFINEAIAGDTQALADNKAILEGTIGTEFPVNRLSAKYKALEENYKKKYGKDMTYASYAQTSYDTVYIFAQGINTVGYNGEKLAAWSRTIKDWEGASGKVTIKPDGDRESGFAPEMVKDGKMVPYTE